MPQIDIEHQAADRFFERSKNAWRGWTCELPRIAAPTLVISGSDDPGDPTRAPVPDRRSRSCITLALLAALGREQELAMHVRAARRNGLSVEEISEVLLPTVIYAGVPAGNAAFAVAERALAEEPTSH